MAVFFIFVLLGSGSLMSSRGGAMHTPEATIPLYDPALATPVRAG